MGLNALFAVVVPMVAGAVSFRGRSRPREKQEYSNEDYRRMADSNYTLRTFWHEAEEHCKQLQEDKAGLEACLQKVQGFLACGLDDQAELSDGNDSTNQQHPPAQACCHSSECAQLRKHCQELGCRLTLTQLQLQAKSTALDNTEAALHAVKADQELKNGKFEKVVQQTASLAEQLMFLKKNADSRQAQHDRALAVVQSQLHASQQSLFAVKTANQAAMTDASTCAELRLQQLSDKHAQERQDLQRCLQALTVECDAALSLGRCTAATTQPVPLTQGAREPIKSLHTDTAGEERGEAAVAQTEGKGGGDMKEASRAPGSCCTWQGPQAHMALMVQNTLKKMQQGQLSIKEDEDEQDDQVGLAEVQHGQGQSTMTKGGPRAVPQEMRDCSMRHESNDRSSSLHARILRCKGNPRETRDHLGDPGVHVQELQTQSRHQT